MQNTPPIGTILYKPENRDAIHIAIAPVEAVQRLYPGQHVGLNAAGKACLVTLGQIGIVDPYLPHCVEAGQRFFLFLYPKTVTSLRHEWTHPAFDSVRPTLPAEASRDWMNSYARSLGVATGEELVVAASKFLKTGKYFSNYGKFQSADELPAEFWDHYEKLTGQSVPTSEREGFFTCSC